MTFPGSTGLTVLDVYDWVAPDGLPGGSAHVHLASTEGYLVASGEGRLQTLGSSGYAETPLRPGDCLWFTPGTIHRLVNDGDLRLFVVMQNAGLPEHGDAVLTFGPEILADPGRYAEAAALPAPGGDDSALAEAARRRAALAVEGYLDLRAAVEEKGPALALEDFYAAATALRGPLVADWRERWRDGALATAELTRTHLDGIEAAAAGGSPEAAGHLAAGALWRIGNPPGERAYGMCGRLTTYPAGAAQRI
ncbi:MAG: cupin domain-containing protein [Nocardiopsaceae bacterium]|nr:cupin domain-containing protein [Nocardiopsaceae bacterium]